MLICIIFLFLVNLNTESYAKYKIEIMESIYDIQIDKNPPVCMIAYSENKITNKDVVVYLKINEEIQEMDGWILEDDGKSAYRVLKKNESNVVILKDLAGNKTEVKYDVNWIDKEAPKIIGVENEEVVNKYLNLEYTDNVEIAKIIKNKIGDLELYINYFYQNISQSYHKGFEKNEITVSIRTMPKGATEFAYYINGELKAISKEKTYTFKNLDEGEIYEFKAETTVNGEKQESNIRQQQTAIFDEIIINENNNILDLNVTNLKENIDNIRISVWNEDSGQDDLRHYYINNIKEKDLDYKIDIANHENKKGIYNIHFYMFDEKGNELGMYPGRYQFIEDREKEYEFNKDGTYEVIVEDTAGNKTDKTFTIDIDDKEKPSVKIDRVIENNNYLVKITEIKDKSKIVKIEYVRNGVVEFAIEKDDIKVEDVKDYSFESINNDSLWVNVYDEIGNCQIVKL